MQKFNIPSIDRGDCMRDYKQKKRLGSGSFGTVIQTCKLNNEQDCNYVTKVASADDFFYRDVYFSKKFGDLGIAPTFYDAWTCKGKGYMVMERYDGDLHRIAEENEKCSTYNSLIIRKDFIPQMFRIAKTLSDHKVVHGDLKLDNFLYDAVTKKVVVTDFGFTTDFSDDFPPPEKVGWLSNTTENKPWICSLPAVFEKYWNSWELATALSQYCVYDNGYVLEFRDIMGDYINESIVEEYDEKYCKSL